MIFELKRGVGIFVRADRIDEITVCGQYAHVHMASGRTHIVHQEPGQTAYMLVEDIQRRANKILIAADGPDLSNPFSHLGQHSMFPGGASPDHP